MPLARKNLAGREIEAQIGALGVTLRPNRRDEPARHNNLSRFRR